MVEATLSSPFMSEYSSITSFMAMPSVNASGRVVKVTTNGVEPLANAGGG
ncbi:hypothetical protein IC006_0964 [Sulfuracidifex tepidarius]|nr:hypothetical protein IC006_0964 [Sulfuracidifex tepidarius]